MNINKENFIEQIREKNPRALEFVVDEYSNLVFKVVRTTLNSEYVEECASDVFWAVWNNIESFDIEKGNFKCWIAAISKYKAIDYMRKLLKESKNENIDDYDLKDSFSIDKNLISKENKKEILQVINTMKEEDREIFIRRYFLHEDIENIARVFGVNRNLVDKRLSRGRKFLKGKLTSLKGELL
ncbi:MULTISPECIES: sigma-70 family RNA polymerase sigma factor [Clostridium]|uniref:sigma-70 family RNA polymerase sigma factor n=1 Tax=Clostridium TaxID=1485 RepID=UPI0008271D6B|nr:MULTISPECIES: sigma-70 family RNA polymerase sigma factor [Clostridium]PJI09792.1 RNA polymerase subunit sigma-70 [Clostridium sp. CT7]